MSRRLASLLAAAPRTTAGCGPDDCAIVGNNAAVPFCWGYPQYSTFFFRRWCRKLVWLSRAATLSRLVLSRATFSWYCSPCLPCTHTYCARIPKVLSLFPLLCALCTWNLKICGIQLKGSKSSRKKNRTKKRKKIRINVFPFKKIKREFGKVILIFSCS